MPTDLPASDDAPWPGSPSDSVPEVLSNGRTSVVAMVLSLSARSPDGEDEAYLRRHALDHLPEQYRISGVRNGTRWVSTPTTVSYLDDDPPEVAARLAPVLAQRWADGAVTPLLAAPFVPVRPFAWDAALPADTVGDSS